MKRLARGSRARGIAKLLCKAVGHRYDRLIQTDEFTFRACARYGCCAIHPEDWQAFERVTELRIVNCISYHVEPPEGGSPDAERTTGGGGS